jgi:carboxyl-terminal processing protease
MLQFMKNKILIPSTILLIIGLILSFQYRKKDTSNSNINEHNIIMNTVMSVIQEGHYSPRDLDDSISIKAFDKFFETIDYEKKYFSKQDYKQFASYRFKLDDEIKSNSLEFFYKVLPVFRKKLDESVTIYTKILKKPFSFDTNDSLEFDYKKIPFSANEKELEEKWEKILKYRTLVKYIDLKEAEDKKVADTPNYVAKDFTTLEKEARESVLKTQERATKRLKKLTDNELFSTYINAITGTMDPHTTYMLPSDRKRFDEMMSGGFIGIGAALQETDDNKIKVSSIITGSPAWRNGKLKAEDIILQVAQGEDMPVDLDGYEINDAIKLIRGKKGTEVRLTVQHSDGTKEVVSIIRDEVVYEEVFAKSSIIEKENKKIGYIFLPEFYADFDGKSTGRRSGKDVEIEVKKLMAENVDGIVLDLRNNGGGSLADVVEMAGIFLGKSPVVQVRSSGNNIISHTSRIAEPIYTGPLTIMINGRSASASEILAAVLQDCGRAVIVGSNSFGKGTVQSIIPLDQVIDRSMAQRIVKMFNTSKGEEANYDGIGSLKLTLQKFYRINGGSTQLKGVKPDIGLPDVYDQLDIYSEKKDPAALPWDKINPVNYTKWHTPLDLAYLNRKSEARVRNNETFRLITQTGARLKKQQENNLVYLNYNKYKDKLKEGKDINDRIEALEKSTDNKMVVKTLKADEEKANANEDAKKKQSEWLDNIKKDIYIGETTNIMLDLIGA